MKMANPNLLNRSTSLGLLKLLHSAGSTSFRDSWLCRHVAQLLVCLMVLQTFPLQVLGQTHHWNPALIPPALEQFFSSFSLGPSSAEAGGLPSLDVDDNGQADALTDGVIVLRFLFGFQGQGLVNGVLALDAQRTEPADILAYLEPLRERMLDVDCNGQADAFTDGFLIARFLMGFTGDSLINGVHDPSGTRSSAVAIQGFLGGFDPLGMDDDGDGFTENQGDCNDGDLAIHPGIEDIPGDGIDQDCNGENL